MGMPPARPHLLTPDEVLDPQLVEVSDGVFAYLQLYGQWGLNNAGFVIGPDGVLVVDTCFTVARAQAFRRRIEATTDVPPRVLVNTHHHGDHTHGNFLFRDTTIIGHERCREAVLGTDLESTKRLFANEVDWGPIEIEPPAVTFTDRLDLHVGDVRVEAHFVGPAHTTNDVVYHLPDRRVLFAGDLAFAGGTPFVMMGSVQGSLDAYRRLQALDVDTVVPGHGPVCGPEAFADAAGYLQLVQDAAREGRAAGLSPLELARDLDLGGYAGWHDAERVVGNLHRAYAELDGRPLGEALVHGPVVADMVALTGGHGLHCPA
jgi:cyclase